MRPVLEGLCRFESLKDGTLDLVDVALLNDALSVRADNRALQEQWLANQKPRHG